MSSIAQSAQGYRGDEAELLPNLPGFFVLDAHAAYDVLPALRIFVRAHNLLDTEYETFGALADPSEVFDDFSDPRFQSPGPPFAIFAGVSTVDEPLLALAARLEEDLRASADVAARLLAVGPQASPDAVRALTAVLARQADVFERTLRGAVGFADLFGDEPAARLLRERLASTHAERSRIRTLASNASSGEGTDDVRGPLWTACASLPSLQRSQADQLLSLARSASGIPPRPTERDS